MRTYLLGAIVLFARKDRFRQGRVHRELGHPPPEFRELAAVVEGSERVQIVESADERVARGRVEKVKADQVIDAQTLEHEDDHAEICPLYLGHRVLLEFVHKGVLRVQPEAFAGTDSAGSAGSLSCRSSRTWRDDERLHAVSRVVGVLLDKAGIDDVDDAVDGDGRFGNVGGEDDL